MSAAELQAAAWGAKQASARNKGSARNGTWGRKSARNRLSVHLGQRSEALMQGMEITDGERRISGLGKMMNLIVKMFEFALKILDVVLQMLD